MTVKADIGIIGLGVMGRSLALNMCDSGYNVAVYNRNQDVLQRFIDADDTTGKSYIPCHTLEEFIETIKPPRPIMLMVTAGKAVDTVIESLLPLLQKNDIIIDGGNSYFEDTLRRNKYLSEKSISFVGAGVSGGEEGARHGPSIMPGGQREAYKRVESILLDISAKVEGKACCSYIGADGAGHYVKMVHNGIEYADMQLISEAYYIMKNLLGMDYPQMKSVFEEWNKGELSSFLIEITADILGKVDPDTGSPMLEVILDTAGQKGTGKWTGQSALEIGAAAPTITEAVFCRSLSMLKNEREKASSVFKTRGVFTGDKDNFLTAIHDALLASKIMAYAQGFSLIQQAAKEYSWDIDLAEVALIWRAGCIIRAQFLERISEAYKEDAGGESLIFASYFKEKIKQASPGWREVVSECAKCGVPVPAFSSALSYFDSYCSENLWANMIQAQRDYFGAHTFERTDSPRGELFHHKWY